MKQLYIQTAFLGDLLLAIPTLKQMRQWKAASDITLVCRKGFGDMMLQFGVVDEVIELDKKNKSTTLTQLKGRDFDAVFCPHQSLTSHRLVSTVRSPIKMGYKTFWNSPFFSSRVRRNIHWPEVMRQMQLMGLVSEDIQLKLEAFANNDTVIPVWAQMKLPQLRWSHDDLDRLFSKKLKSFLWQKPYICIAPGSVWRTKRWSDFHFVETATQIVRHGFQIAVIGAPDERSLCDQIAQQVPNSFSLAGQLSVMESLMVLSRSKGLICNDSGAMHMASLLSLPTVSLFGPTVKELGYWPWNPFSEVIEMPHLMCRPCGQHGSQQCPIQSHRCMLDIKPQTVINKALPLFS